MNAVIRQRLIVGFGYLGTRVAPLWTNAGDVVYATTRRADRFAAIEAAGCRPVLWDVLAPAGEGAIGGLARVDTVLYCVGFDRRQGREMRDVYVDGLSATLDRLPPFGRLLYISSTGVFGDAAGEWIDEQSPPAPIDPAGEVCLEAERLLQRRAAEMNWDVVVFRLAGIYGPGRMIGLESLREGRPIAGDPTSHLNLIHVEDAANVVAAAADRPDANGCYIVADGRPVQRRDFYEYSAQQIGAPPPMFDGSAARRGRGDRRLCSDRMKRELSATLRYPDFRAGLQSCGPQGSAGSGDSNH
jgi:nucleoside-diphosphate-sugar epimerase